MIKREELIKIGKVTKTHGINGEVSVLLQDDITDIDSSPYLICDIDGIFVPFFIEEYRFRSDSAILVKFENTENEDAARILVNKEVFFSKIYMQRNDEEGEPSDYFIGYKTVVSGHELGVITDIDDTTVNILFTVKSDTGEEFLIPATVDFIEDIDHEGKVIFMDLPDGLLDI